MSFLINKKDLNTLIIEYVAQHQNCSDQRAKDRILEKLRYNHKKLIAENNFPIIGAAAKGGLPVRLGKNIGTTYPNTRNTIII